MHMWVILMLTAFTYLDFTWREKEMGGQRIGLDFFLLRRYTTYIEIKGVCHFFIPPFMVLILNILNVGSHSLFTTGTHQIATVLCFLKD